MNAVLVLLIAIAACFALRNPLKKAPFAFYVLAAIVVVAFLMLDSLDASRSVRLAFFWTIQKCLVPLALFIVVMYIGVLPRTSKVALWLRPIRAELSIVAWILTLGHVVVYLQSYLSPLIGGAGVRNNVMIGIVVAIGLFVLLILLGITSFKSVKKHMDARGWKAVQRLAYLFFGLVYVHLLLLLMPAAIGGGDAAIASMLMYTAIFGIYAVARVHRFLIDRTEEQSCKLSEDEAAN